MKGDYVMTEKDLELQDLKKAYANVARSDLYKAVVYDCKCSLCGVYESCSKLDMEEGCFVWKKDLAAN